MLQINPVEIIAGYRQGYFLMDNGEGLGWYSSQSRTLMPLDEQFRYPRSLRRYLNQNRFTPAINRDFVGVVNGCANRESTWISGELKDIYLALYQAGWAYSYETWQGDQLAGGILGLVIGGVFIGESMFFNIPEGSKVAMVKLVEHLRSQQFLLFDVQIMNPHLARFGAYTISEKEYQHQLQQALQLQRRL
ncbi:leucyl/phenylalanyl-tRNA--protein transferase [Acaryochloris sp. IP29b_bin.148]|uniref:leucyl/phenylalanyl-tRNA--protein transferase n=1 Tax=Acaryochloris sp. IP29b_bin.148 TaxID=2969218 RepID=UPI002633C648|nr:leucyl/phenylalanyl-tRNA--protein transferase [Acaryochloris sp. IP29b_bin.148]